MQHVWSCWNKSWTGSTCRDFFTILLWSLEALFLGQWPARDWRGMAWEAGTREAGLAGQQLAGGYRAVVVAFTGDMDFYNLYLQMPRSTSNEPCSLCRCTKRGPRTWHRLDRLAGWRETVWETRTWRAWESRSMNVFFKSRLHTALTVHYDLMHVKYLGYVQYLYGSVLQILTHDIMDADPLTNLRTLWRFIKQRQRVEASSPRITAPYGQRLNKLTMFVKKKNVQTAGQGCRDEGPGRRRAGYVALLCATLPTEQRDSSALAIEQGVRGHGG